MKEEGKKKKLFDYCIGNPPYQEEIKDTSDKPIYNFFIDETYKISSCTELITPARFLFNAGKTSKIWNEKMLNDKHFKVKKYEINSKNIFGNNIDIKGGVAIHYHDDAKEFGAIKTFTSFNELNSILNKVNQTYYASLQDITFSQSSYRISKKFHDENPVESDKLGNSAKNFFASNVFDVLSNGIFYDIAPDDGNEYIQLYGRANGKRVYKYIRAEYVEEPGNLNYYKVFVPKSNGSGAIGEIFSTPVVGTPVVGHTQTFISIGKFDTLVQAENALKYIKSKFVRCMVGILKGTQDNPPAVWKYVPIQDFTNESDIDWSKPIKEIDQQLYKKYNLSEEEIKFIEEKVREME